MAGQPMFDRIRRSRTLDGAFSRIHCTIFICCALMILTGCVRDKMSAQEASRLSVVMSEKPFVPPPRRATDILAMLRAPGAFDPELTRKMIAAADATAPDTTDPDTLAVFFYHRGVAAQDVGRYGQQLHDFRQALSHGQVNGIAAMAEGDKLLLRAGAAELTNGNFKRGRQLLKESLRLKPGPSAFYLLAASAYKAGDLETGDRFTRKGLRFTNRAMARGLPPIKEASLAANRERMLANQFNTRGRHRKAESHQRKAVDVIRNSRLRTKLPFVYFKQRVKLAKYLAAQGKLVAAELEARQVLKEALAHGGLSNAVTGEITNALGKIFLEQGRVAEAETVIGAGIRILAESGLTEDSYIMGRGLRLLGEVAVAQRDFKKAAAQFQRAESGMTENRFLYDTLIADNPNVILTGLMTGQAKALDAQIQTRYESHRALFGADSYKAAEALAFRAVAHADLGRTQQAIADFSKSLPKLFDRNHARNARYLKVQRRRVLAEQYIHLLGRLHGHAHAKTLAVDPSAEAFRWAENSKGGRIQGALSAAAVRSKASDPEMAELVRKSQDTQKQIDTFQTILTDSLAAPNSQQDPAAVAGLTQDLKTLKRVRNALENEITSRFPQYDAVRNPETADIAAIQAVLAPWESFVAIHPTPTRTYIWAIPGKGRPAFAVSQLGRDRLGPIVANLRKALDPKPTYIQDIPAFDLALAHELYRQLLEPVRAGWRDARELMVSVSGPIASIPMAVLPTAPVAGSDRDDVRFDRYRSVPWLVRRVAVTRVPSATAFLNARRSPTIVADGGGFAGFGDPYFNPRQAAAELAIETDTRVADAGNSNRSKVAVRGIRLTEGGSLDTASLASCTIERLQRLADTRDEIRGIAQVIGADLDRDVFLGRHATENRVKSMDLSQRRVIAFATHALLPGDLDGLHQPALALSAPSVTGDAGDGLLTMEEILRLRLNADWVVLSACNTGGAEKEGEEALSGLGQAFFYAGARAILVSMWPVETASARLLTTQLFRLQARHPDLSRSQAHRRSILHLMDNEYMTDPATGQSAVSYAHPIFWAPFIVVANGSGAF